MSAFSTKKTNSIVNPLENNLCIKVDGKAWRMFMHAHPNTQKYLLNYIKQAVDDETHQLYVNQRAIMSVVDMYDDLDEYRRYLEAYVVVDEVEVSGVLIRTATIMELSYKKCSKR